MESIFLLTQTFEEFNQTGLDNLFVYVSQTTPSFIPWIAFALTVIISTTIYYGSIRYGGQGDFFTAITVGLFITNLFLMILSLKPGIVSIRVFSVTIILLIFSVIGLFFSKKGAY